MLRAPFWALCCCLAVADGLLGCDTTCEKESAAPLAVLSGLTSPSCTGYQTNVFDQRYLDFPPGRRLRLVHGLGQTPNLVQSYVAFVADPLTPGETGKYGNTAESAGNQVIIEAVNDEFVQVRNDTCEYFYLRVVIEVDAPDPTCLGNAEGGASGASGAGGAGG